MLKRPSEPADRFSERYETFSEWLEGAAAEHKGPQHSANESDEAAAFLATLDQRIQTSGRCRTEEEEPPA